MMDTTRYQKFVNKTAFFPRSTQGRNISYLVMGIVEEVGEIYEFILKKQKLKEGDNNLNEYVANQIVKELGDLVWYITAICNEISFSLGRLMQYTKVKLGNNPNHSSLLLYLGDLSGAVKKMIRDDQEVITEEKSNLIITNLCHVMIYVLQICKENQVKFETVLEVNMNKIKNRKKKGTLHGSGNDR